MQEESIPDESRTETEYSFNSEDSELDKTKNNQQIIEPSFASLDQEITKK